MAPEPATEPLDRVLLQRSRRGDRDAFAELWRRHAPSGLVVARGLRAAEPDDLVADSFADIYRLVLDGKGPRDSFRAYLFTTIRHRHVAVERARRESPDDELDALAHPSSEPAAIDLGHDLAAAADAFESLPPRWQEVLWYTEVDGLTPQQTAPLIGRSANTTAALAYRAREALRQAWIGAQLAPSDDPQCRWTRERLGGWTRERLGPRDHGKVERHLRECDDCTAAAAEARLAAARLDAIMPKVVLGLGAIATAGTGALVGGTAGGAAPAIPAAVWNGAGPGGGTAAGGATAGATAAGVSSSVAIGIGAAVAIAVAAGIVGIAAFGAGHESAPLADASAPAATAPSGSSGSEAPSTDAPRVPSTPPAEHPKPGPTPDAHTEPTLPPLDAPAPDAAAPALPPAAGAAPAAPDRTPAPPRPDTAAPNPGPVDPAPEEPETTEPAPEPGPTDPGPTDPGPTDPGPTDPGPTDPGPTDPGPTDPGTDPEDPGPTTPEPDVTAPDAPVLGTLDTAGGLAQPILDGTGEPGASLELLVDGRPTATVAVGDDGTWHAAAAGLAAGAHELRLRQTDAAGNVSATTTSTFVLEAPRVVLRTLGPLIVGVEVVGRAGATVRIDGLRGFDAVVLDRRGRFERFALGIVRPSRPITAGYTVDGRPGAVVAAESRG